jgi:hypothetical protein
MQPSLHDTGCRSTARRRLSRTSLKPGAAVRVLVDPRDPGYAELPGQRHTQKSAAQVSAAVFLGCLAVFTFVAAWWGRVWYLQRRRIRISPDRPRVA